LIAFSAGCSTIIVGADGHTERESAAPGALAVRGWDPDSAGCASFRAGMRRCRVLRVTVSNVGMHVAQYHVGIPCAVCIRGIKVLHGAAQPRFIARRHFFVLSTMSSALCARP